VPFGDAPLLATMEGLGLWPGSVLLVHGCAPGHVLMAQVVGGTCSCSQARIWRRLLSLYRLLPRMSPTWLEKMGLGRPASGRPSEGPTSLPTGVGPAWWLPRSEPGRTIRRDRHRPFQGRPGAARQRRAAGVKVPQLVTAAIQLAHAKRWTGTGAVPDLRPTSQTHLSEGFIGSYGEAASRWYRNWCCRRAWVAQQLKWFALSS
jgi:hypothetical protein